MHRIGACLVVVVGALAWSSAALGATTFGTDLNRPANNTATCSDFLFFGGPTTCSAESINPFTGESGFPPAGDGVVTRVRVKVGPVTGPMQVVVEQALRRDNPSDPGHPTYACCKAVAASAVFTPAANAVTAVDVNLPVKQSVTPEPGGFYVDEHLALSVLATNVPIPASLDQNASVGLWFPAWTVGEERAGSFGTSGADVLLSADWDPVGAGGGAGAASPVALASNVAKVRRDKALVDLLCNLSTACDGRLLIQNQQAAKAGAPKLASKKPKTYARAKLSIPAGKTKTVKAKLKRAGKKALKKRRKVTAWANIELEGSSAVVPPLKLKLKRKR